ncbi:MAG: hypothetical protein ACLTDX_03900 [[Clostridium] innocuum]
MRKSEPTCRSRKYERVVFNHDLSPLQIRNLEEILQTPVMDRTELDSRHF